MTSKSCLLTAAGLVAFGLSAQAATYPGNGNAGFGGAIGGASLTLTDDGTTVSGTLTKGAGDFNDVLVLYIDSVAGGFADTSGFADDNDGLRKAISGFDGGANRSLMTFASGFAPDYAIALGPWSDNFGGIWQLADGGANSLLYLDTVNLSPTGDNTSAAYTFSFTLANLGLTAGQSFGLFGTYTSNSGYRSDEAIAGDATGAQGWSPFTQDSFGTYTSVPEPASMTLFGLAGLAVLLFRQRK